MLYEGARLNRILRINDSWYEKMVEILDIPWDSDEEIDYSEEEDKKEEIWGLPYVSSILRLRIL